MRTFKIYRYVSFNKAELLYEKATEQDLYKLFFQETEKLFESEIKGYMQNLNIDTALIFLKNTGFFIIEELKGGL